MPRAEMTLREPLALSVLAAHARLTRHGPDLEIGSFGSLNIDSASPGRMLTWINRPELALELDRSGIGACVTSERVAAELGDHPCLVSDEDPTAAFYSLFAWTAREGMWNRLESRRGANVEIADSAVVHDDVQLGDECVIGDNAVVMPNSRLGDRVNVKANATIGGEGFEVREIDGRSSMVPHCGGVWIGDDVQIGSQTCVDRGMFGSFTEVGDRTRIDNLVHVGHSAVLGEDGIAAACTELGTIKAERGFWLGPRSCVLQGVVLGHNSYAGIGSVIVRDIPPHALAYGSPAKQHGWVCRCRTKLRFGSGRAACSLCGREYVEQDGAIAEATPAPAA